MEHHTPPSGDTETRRKERHRKAPLLPEVRLFRGQEGLEIREADREGNLVTIRGALVVYDQPYTVLDMLGEFEERMLPGVARDVMTGDTRYLYNHTGMVLARTAAGTLALEDSPRALWTNATVDVRNTHANDLVVAVERGDVNQMSVGFVCGDDEWSDDFAHRSVVRFSLMPDASAVSFPCSPTTSLEVAHRMAMEMPVESRARVRRLSVSLRGLDIRAGKVLSAANQDKVAAAFNAIHGLASAAGLDPDDLIEQPADDEASGDSEAQADGTAGGNGANGEGLTPVASDGSGARQEDPGEKMRSAPATPEERRAASLSFGDQESAVYEALCEHLGGVAGVDVDIWICDCANDWVVWESFYGDSGQWRIAYSAGEDGTIAFDGSPEMVERVTSYRPVEEDRSDANSPSGKTSRALWLRAEARKRRVL